MKVSRTVAYAVQALLQLANAEPHTAVSCGKLAAEGRMPERFLLQILRALVKGGILTSVRGVEGGYRLARPADQITLMDVFEAFDQPMIASVPPLEKLPDGARELLLKSIGRVAASTRAELQGITLDALSGADRTVRG